MCIILAFIEYMIPAATNTATAAQSLKMIRLAESRKIHYPQANKLTRLAQYPKANTLSTGQHTN